MLCNQAGWPEGRRMVRSWPLLLGMHEVLPQHQAEWSVAQDAGRVKQITAATWGCALSPISRMAFHYAGL